MPAVLWTVYFADRGISAPPYEIVGQPEFFTAVNHLVQARPLADWKVYLRWHLLHDSAPFLSAAFEQENFNFFGQGVERPAGTGTALETGRPYY